MWEKIICDIMASYRRKIHPKKHENIKEKVTGDEWHYPSQLWPQNAFVSNKILSASILIRNSEPKQIATFSSMTKKYLISVVMETTSFFQARRIIYQKKIIGIWIFEYFLQKVIQ